MILDNNKFFTEKELASHYSVSLRWVRRIRYTAKDFPYYKLNGRVYYKEIEIDKWFKINLIPM
jgi:hypothetical protein